MEMSPDLSSPVVGVIGALLGGGTAFIAQMFKSRATLAKEVNSRIELLMDGYEKRINELRSEIGELKTRIRELESRASEIKDYICTTEPGVYGAHPVAPVTVKASTA